MIGRSLDQYFFYPFLSITLYTTLPIKSINYILSVFYLNVYTFKGHLRIIFIFFSLKGDIFCIYIYVSLFLIFNFFFGWGWGQGYPMDTGPSTPTNPLLTNISVVCWSLCIIYTSAKRILCLNLKVTHK